MNKKSNQHPMNKKSNNILNKSLSKVKNINKNIQPNQDNKDKDPNSLVTKSLFKK